MRTSYIKSIRYNLVSADSIIYTDKCLPLDFEDSLYKIKLKDTIITFYFKDKMEPISLDGAKRMVEPFLESWKIYTTLISSEGEFNFKYLDYEKEVISNIIIPELSEATIKITGLVKCLIEKNKYPEIPKNFSSNTDVEILFYRYLQYLNGNEPLLSMAYFCLSYLENISGGTRSKAVKKYAIEKDVINRLGDLSSARGDVTSARKGNKHDFKPLTFKEEKWVEKCVKSIILRIGEINAGGKDLKIIAMDSI